MNAQKITATDMAIVNGDMRSATVKNASGDVIVRFSNTGMEVNGGSIQINGGLSDGNISSASSWNAKETPEGAQSKVNAAKTELNNTIASVSGNLSSFETTVNTTFKDGIISNAEALSIKSNVDVLESQKTALSSQYVKLYADTALSGTVKTNLNTAHSNFVTAHNNLISSINTASSNSEITNVERTDVASKFSAYRVTVDTLQTRIEEAFKFITDAYATSKANAAEGAAKSYTDGIKTALDSTINAVSGNLSSFETTVNTTFKDGIIGNAESLSIKSNVDILNSEKESLTTQYNKVYADTLLTGAAKTNLASAKTAFDTSHTNLVTSINNATSDKAITDTERTDVANKFTDYRAKLATYQQRLDEAWTFVYNQYSENKANQAKTDAITSVKTSLRVASDLPTSISMGTFGIRATTSDAEKYAQLDYRGLYIKNGAIEIDGGVNGVRLNATEGLISESSLAKVSLNAQTGIKITKKSNSEDVFFVDAEGNLNVRNIKILSGSITWSNVNNQPVETQTVTWDSLQNKPQTYIDGEWVFSPNIGGNTIRGSSIIGGSITGNYISGSTISGTTITSGSSSNKVEMSNSELYTYYSSGSQTSITKLSDGQLNFSNSYSSSYRTGYIKLNPFSGTSSNYTSEFEINTNCAILSIVAPAINLYPSSGSQAMVRGNTIATETWVSNNYASRYHSHGGEYASAYHTHSQYVQEGTTVYFNAIGVGGYYQNTINPTNTIINSNNIAVPGSVYARGSALTSSVVFKTNIKPLPDGALTVLRDVNIYEYHYQDDVDNLNFENKQIGVLAEAVPAILRGGENQAINPYAMTSVLWKAVQEQQELIVALQEKVALLEEIQ